MLSHNNLAAAMRSNLSMKMVPGMTWTIDEIENLTPFEKDAYMLMINDHLKKKEAGRNKS